MIVTNIQKHAKKGTEYIWASQTENASMCAASFEVGKQTFPLLIQGRMVFHICCFQHSYQWSFFFFPVLVVSCLLQNQAQNLSEVNVHQCLFVLAPQNLFSRFFPFLCLLGCKTNSLLLHQKQNKTTTTEKKNA